MKEIKKKNWYVFYTSPRAEKKVNEYLLSLGYESFLPLKSEVPAVISGNDIMSLKIMQEMDVEILRNNEFSSGDKIRIIDGPLCGYEGILIEIKGKKKFGVSISCVNLTAVVDLNTSKMEKCDISNNFREVIIFK